MKSCSRNFLPRLTSVRILALHYRLWCTRWTWYSTRLHSLNRSSIPLLPPPPRECNRNRRGWSSIRRYRLPPTSPIPHSQNRFRVGDSHLRLHHALPKHHRYSPHQSQHPAIAQSHFTPPRYQDPPPARILDDSNRMFSARMGTLRTSDLHHQLCLERRPCRGFLLPDLTNSMCWLCIRSLASWSIFR